MPFAGYDDFEACERANSDKRDPGAYCAAIQRATEQYDGDPDDVVDVDEAALDAIAAESADWERHGDEQAIAWVDTAGGAVVYQQDSYTDYPEAAKENAQMALDAREETGNPNDCGRREGWMRANQLADGEAISRDTVGRMAAFDRHRDNSDMSDDEGRADCGWMMWKAWGGDEGIEWAAEIVDGESGEEQSRVAGEAVVIDGLSDEARQSITEKYNVEIRDADADE